MTPDFSVIVPTYNRAVLLDAAIESVCAQTYPGPIELVIVDDGSTDETLKVISRWRPTCEGSRFAIRYLRLDHAGVCTARNRGIAESSAPLVAFLDSDDLWQPEKLQTQARHFSDPTIGVTHTSFRYIGPDRRFLDANPQRLDNPCQDSCLRALLKEDLVIFSSVVARREALIQAAAMEPHGLPFDPRWVCGEDYDLLLRIALRWRFAYDAQPLTHYRIHEAQTGMSDLQRVFGYHCRVQMDFARRHGGAAGVSAAEAEQFARDFLYARAESQYWQRKLNVTRELCDLAEELGFDDEQFRVLRGWGNRPRWLFTVKDAADAAWRRLFRRPADPTPSVSADPGSGSRHQPVSPPEPTPPTPIPVPAFLNLDADTPLVAVIIPSYNRAEYLPAALESVYVQEFAGKIEILVIDDGSTDQTQTALAPFLARQNPRISLRFLQLEHQGVCTARNRGLAETRAPFVAFLDSDDVWAPSKLARQIVRFANPEIGVVHTAFRTIDRSGRFQDQAVQRPDNPCHGRCLRTMLAEDRVIFSSVLVRRSLIEEAAASEPHGLPFDPQWTNGQDYDLLLRVALRSSFAYDPQPLTFYRIHDAQQAMGNLQRVFGYHCRVQMDFARRHGAEAGVTEAEGTKMARDFLYTRAGSLYWQRNLEATQGLCALARELGFFDPEFAELEHRAHRPSWLLRTKDRLDRWKRRLFGTVEELNR